MRVVINEGYLNRNRKIAHALFLISLVGMVGGFIMTWTSPESSSSISCLILPILLFMTITSVRMANQWIREPRPEKMLAEGLKGLGPKYTLFHHLLPAPHVLIGPEGVFVLATFWHEKTYQVVGKKWAGEGSLPSRILGYLRQDLIGNPFQEAVYQAQQLQRLINKIAPDAGIEVQPLVVFTSPRVTLDIQDPVLPVLYADPKKKPSLRQYLRDQKNAGRATLSLEHLDQIDRLYGLITRADLAEAGYTPADDESDEDDAGTPAPDGPGSKGEAGTVYIAQAGQLYYIGILNDSPEESLARLESEAQQPVELIHSFETAEPQAAESALHRRFARKRQKGQWFGLSRKDIAWVKSFKGAQQQ